MRPLRFPNVRHCRKAELLIGGCMVDTHRKSAKREESILFPPEMRANMMSHNLGRMPIQPPETVPVILIDGKELFTCCHVGSDLMVHAAPSLRTLGACGFEFN